MVATDIRAANRNEAEAAPTAKAAEDACQAATDDLEIGAVDVVDANMADTTNVEAASTTTDESVDDESDGAHTAEALLTVIMEPKKICLIKSMQLCTNVCYSCLH